MILKPRMAFGAILLFLSCALTVYSFSLSPENYAKYVKPNCYNQGTVLGQVRPNGMTVENLISMLQRAELQYPDMKPTELLSLFLQRFHFDGLHPDKFEQSPIGYRHSRLTQVILDGSMNKVPSIDLLEKIFTADEKCNLFFTLSHSINQTAEEDEHEDNKYQEQVQSRSQDKQKPQGQDLGNDIPIKKDPKSLPPDQSAFVDDEKPNVPNKRSKRENSRRTLTKKPREMGVSSFLSASTEPMAMGRVLLGLYAGYAKFPKQKMSQILSLAGSLPLKEGVDDKEVDPLMAVTLSDLYGMPPGDSISPSKMNFFGAEGSWNITECQTKFVLTTNEGIWATAADFRGAIDGFNLGKSIDLFSDKLTPSQALRFYYSKQGFIESGICKREDKSRSEISDDLKNEGEAYLHLWNAFHFSNQHTQGDINQYSNNLEQYFRVQLQSAMVPNPEEAAMCKTTTNGKIDSAEVETNADIYFMLDAKNSCDEPDTQARNPRTIEQCNKTAQIISKITSQLKLNRYHGTVSVFYNVKSLSENNLVDDSGNKIQTKLHSRLYNSTSNQCASCRALDATEKSWDTIEKRSELFELMRQQIEDLKKAPRADNQGLPSKVFYWFDTQTVELIPEDKNKKLEVENILKALKFTHRDVQYFGVGTNETNLKDLVTQPENLINLNEQSKLEDFVLRAVQAPQIFEYPLAANSTSNNVTIQNYITPGYRQFWMMSPTQFIRSNQITFTFKATEYAIEVCLGREPQPDRKPANCKHGDKLGDSITFKTSNPCQGMLFEKCPAFYFTVNVNQQTKSSVTNVQAYCVAKDCQNILQTPWYFTHTGVRGNGSNALGTSILLISIAFILQKFYNHLF